MPIVQNTKDAGGNSGISTDVINKLIAAADAADQKVAKTTIPILVQECQKFNVTDKGQIAYVLATAAHESKLGRWMEEFDKGEKYEGRKDLGNDQAGDGPKFKGRGFCQITGRRNYTDWSKRLGIDLVAAPEKAKDFTIAARIIVQGMRDGTFTSKKIATYITADKKDFYSARQTINGINTPEREKVGHEVERLANKFYAVLTGK